MVDVVVVGGSGNDTIVECALLFHIMIAAAPTIAVKSSIVARCGIGCALLSIKMNNTSMYIAMLCERQLL